MISANNLKKLYQPHVLIDENKSYGLGWGIDHSMPETLVTHDGMMPGYQLIHGFLPKQRIGMIVTININMQNSNSPAKALLYRFFQKITQTQVEDLSKIYFEEYKRLNDSLSKPDTVTLLPSHLNKLVGTYQSIVPGNIVEVYIEKKQLKIKVGKAKHEAALKPLSETRFYVTFDGYLKNLGFADGGRVQFQEDMNGAISFLKFENDPLNFIIEK